MDLLIIVFFNTNDINDYEAFSGRIVALYEPNDALDDAVDGLCR